MRAQGPKTQSFHKENIKIYLLIPQRKYKDIFVINKDFFENHIDVVVLNRCLLHTMVKW